MINVRIFYLFFSSSSLLSLDYGGCLGTNNQPIFSLILAPHATFLLLLPFFATQQNSPSPTIIHANEYHQSIHPARF